MHHAFPPVLCSCALLLSACGSSSASSDTDAGGVGLGGFDASITDGGGANDGNVQDAHNVDTGSTGKSDASTCTHDFCADFDEPGALMAWTNTTNLNGGSGTLSTAESVSAPSSFLAKTVSSASSAQPAFAALEKDLPSPQLQMQVALDVRVNSFGTFQRSQALILTNASNDFTITLGLQSNVPNQVTLFVSWSTKTAGIAGRVSGSFATTQWKHIIVNAGFDTAATPGGSLVVTVDSQPAFSDKLPVKPPTNGVQMSIGAQAHMASEQYFDNVAVDIQ